MKTYLQALIILIVTVFSCTEDDVSNNNSTALITIHSTENLNTNNEHWIIISDKEGKVLASGELTQDSTFTTNSLIGDFINVTFIEINGENIFNISTYTEIALNEEWYIKNSFPIANPANMKSSIIIKNMDVNDSNNQFLYSVSNHYGSVLESLEGIMSDLIINFRVEESFPEEVLVVINDGIQDPRYTWLSEEILYGYPTYDYEEDFEVMDHVLNYSFNKASSIYMDIVAFNKDKLSRYFSLKGNIQSEFFSHNMPPTAAYAFKMGYLDGFDYYRCRLSMGLAGRGYYYEKFGNPTEVFDEILFDSDFNVTNTDFNSFAFNASGDFDVAEGVWSQKTDKTIRWKVCFPIPKTDNVVQIDLPNVIKDKYSDLSLDNLTYEQASFTDIINNGSYSNFIDYSFNNENGDKLIEFYSITQEGK